MHIAIQYWGYTEWIEVQIASMRWRSLASPDCFLIYKVKWKKQFDHVRLEAVTTFETTSEAVAGNTKNLCSSLASVKPNIAIYVYPNVYLMQAKFCQWNFEGKIILLMTSWP